MNRRHLLAHGFALGPLTSALLAACGDDAAWPEGMLPIHWDRDTCTRCSMAISDRRFAAQVRGGPKNTAYKFDDIGCATSWCAEKNKEHAWLDAAATHFWVAEFGAKGQRFLAARQAHYVAGPSSPMGYNLAAHATPQTDSLNFDEMRKKTAAAWPANCRTTAPSAGASAP